jgi:hypothetical protein
MKWIWIILAVVWAFIEWALLRDRERQTPDEKWFCPTCGTWNASRQADCTLCRSARPTRTSASGNTSRT